MAQVLSGLALAATLVAPILFYTDTIELSQVKQWMIFAALVWFVATPLWMEHQTD